MTLSFKPGAMMNCVVLSFFCSLNTPVFRIIFLKRRFFTEKKLISFFFFRSVLALPFFLLLSGFWQSLCVRISMRWLFSRCNLKKKIIRSITDSHGCPFQRFSNSMFSFYFLRYSHTYVRICAFFHLAWLRN